MICPNLRYTNREKGALRLAFGQITVDFEDPEEEARITALLLTEVYPNRHTPPWITPAFN